MAFGCQLESDLISILGSDFWLLTPFFLSSLVTRHCLASVFCWPLAEPAGM